MFAAGAHGCSEDKRPEETNDNHDDDSDNESELDLDDDSGLDLDEDEERNIGTAISHVDLSKLKKSTAGDGPQSAMLAMTPVSNISELNLIVQLVDSHVTNTSKSKNTCRKRRVKKRALGDAIAVDYVTLASAFNACVARPG